MSEGGEEASVRQRVSVDLRVFSCVRYFRLKEEFRTLFTSSSESFIAANFIMSNYKANCTRCLQPSFLPLTFPSSTRDLRLKGRI